jgi:hypothetical protein
MRINMKRPLVLATIVVAAVGLSGLAAYAYWTTTGAGTGTAATGTNQAVTVTQIGTVPSLLAPGSTAQAIDFKINNPLASKQYVATVTVSIVDVRHGGAAGTIASGGCTAADFTLVQPTAINTDLVNGDTSYTAGTSKGATIAMINTLANQDDCKGITVNLAFAAA